MATNKRDLKHFVRYGGDGKIIPGGNILNRKKPKLGNWVETNAYECCSGIISSSSEQWLMSEVYAPFLLDGYMMFPDHLNGICSLDPNEVGLFIPVSATMIYINTSLYPVLNQMAGHSGTLTLTQNGDSIKFAFGAGAFLYGGYGPDIVYFDWWMNSSVLGELTITSSSTGAFTTTDPITISVTIN